MKLEIRLDEKKIGLLANQKQKEQDRGGRHRARNIELS